MAFHDQLYVKIYSGTDNLMTLIESNNALQWKVDTV